MSDVNEIKPKPKPTHRLRSSSTFSDSYSRQVEEEEGLNNGRATSSSSSSSRTTATVIVSRSVTIPDQVRVDRCHRLPEYGPRILFFSGGSAIKELSCVLKSYTHNSVHLITPFDSGGSSAEIRRAFQMLSVGDLRNRLMALADDSALGNPAVVSLFSHRLHPTNAQVAKSDLTLLLSGEHELIKAVSMPMKSILMSHLRWFASRMPSDFDMRGASVGNLIITGCFLEHDRDIVTAIYLIWKLVGVKGRVRPLTGANLHIRTLYEDGTEEVGQHKMGKSNTVEGGGGGGGEHRVRCRKIKKVDLVRSLHPSSPERQNAQTCTVDPVSADLVDTADLICFPMGSFFGSVLVNLLPKGVGKAIVKRNCPKVYIPNTGIDPEMAGYTLLECVRRIIDMVRTDAGVDTAVKDILQFVLLDTTNFVYCVPIDKEKIMELGIEIIDVPLVEESTAVHHQHGDASETAGEPVSLVAGSGTQLCPKKVVEVLVTLGS